MSLPQLPAENFPPKKEKVLKRRFTPPALLQVGERTLIFSPDGKKNWATSISVIPHENITFVLWETDKGLMIQRAYAPIDEIEIYYFPED